MKPAHTKTPFSARDMEEAYLSGRADALAEVLAVVKAEKKRWRAELESSGYCDAEARASSDALTDVLSKLRRLGRVVPERKGK